jgi:hypothetical protein
MKKRKKPRINVSVHYDDGAEFRVDDSHVVAGGISTDPTPYLRLTISGVDFYVRDSVAVFKAAKDIRDLALELERAELKSLDLELIAEVITWGQDQA